MPDGDGDIPAADAAIPQETAHSKATTAATGICRSILNHLSIHSPPQAGPPADPQT